MNGILGLLSAPAVAAAVDGAGQAIRAAASPFALAMQAAMGGVAESDRARLDAQGGDESLATSVAQRMQQVLSSLGLNAGDRVALQIDASGAISVTGGDASAEAVEAALGDDPQLSGDLRHLARFRGATSGEPFRDVDLRVEVGEPGDAAQLRWH